MAISDVSMPQALRKKERVFGIRKWKVTDVCLDIRPPGQVRDPEAWGYIV